MKTAGNRDWTSKTVSQQFEIDLQHYEADRKKYRFIRVCEANQTFTVYIKQKYAGSRKTLSEAVKLRDEVMQ